VQVLYFFELSSGEYRMVVPYFSASPVVLEWFLYWHTWFSNRMEASSCSKISPDYKEKG